MLSTYNFCNFERWKSHCVFIVIGIETSYTDMFPFNFSQLTFNFLVSMISYNFISLLDTHICNKCIPIASYLVLTTFSNIL